MTTPKNLNQAAEDIATEYFPVGHYKWVVKRLLVAFAQQALERVDNGTNIEALKEELKGQD